MARPVATPSLDSSARKMISRPCKLEQVRDDWKAEQEVSDGASLFAAEQKTGTFNRDGHSLKERKRERKHFNGNRDQQGRDALELPYRKGHIRSFITCHATVCHISALKQLVRIPYHY